MITTRPGYRDEMDIIMDSTEGEGMRLKIGENLNFVESKASPHGTGTKGMDPHWTIQPKMRDTNRWNMAKIRGI